MNSTDFAKTIAARARARAQMLAMEEGRVAVRDHVGATLERRVESVRRAARHAGRSRMTPQLPKT
jgi:hypothetical protein